MRSSDSMLGLSAVARRAFLTATFVAATLLASGGGALAASPPAETFVQANVQVGLALLNNHTTTAAQKREQFEHFILGLTDMKRIAKFTLGQYRRTATAQEIGRAHV